MNNVKSNSILNEACGAQVEAQEKHITINNSISNMVGLEVQLNTLLSRIRGEPRQIEDIEKSDHHQPSLSEFLVTGNDRINNHCQNSHDLISAIEQELFLKRNYYET